MRAVLAAVLGLSVIVGPGLAAPVQAGPPQDQLRAQIDRVLKVLEDPAMKQDARGKERRVAVRRIAEDIFDFPETAKRSLARHWQPLKPAEREEFVRLFADLLERSYLSQIERYGGEKIAYLGDAGEGDRKSV